MVDFSLDMSNAISTPPTFTEGFCAPVLCIHDPATGDNIGSADLIGRLSYRFVATPGSAVVPVSHTGNLLPIKAN